MIDLTEKTALITGAGRRLGSFITRSCAAHGMNVVIHYRTAANEAEELAAEVRGMGLSAATIQADLADPTETSELIGRAVELAGPLDALINSASVFPESRLLDFSCGELEDSVRVNAFSPLVLSRAFAAQRRQGCIVNLLDSRIVDYDAKHAAYHLSKRMLFSITRMLAVELAPEVRVNAVAPGLVLPPIDGDESYLERLKHTNPLLRYGQGKDVAEAALFLLGSDFVTGQVIFVDGGRHMKGSFYG